MMRYLKSALHLLTAILGVYWGAYLTMTGLYGVPFSLWYGVVFLGGVVLGSGVVLHWFVRRKWTQWLPMLGSVMLAAYFVPALLFSWREFFSFFTAPTSDRILAVATVILTIASLLVAVHNLRAGENLLASPRSQ